MLVEKQPRRTITTRQLLPVQFVPFTRAGSGEPMRPWRQCGRLGRHSRLPSAADAALLDRELASLRLHDHRIALLGFGASGTVLALAATQLLRATFRRFCRLRRPVCHYGGRQLRGGERLPFNPLAIVWDARQLIWLALSYALLVLPFFFGGGAIGLAFSRLQQRIGRLYAFDLVGPGSARSALSATFSALADRNAARHRRTRPSRREPRAFAGQAAIRTPAARSPGRRCRRARAVAAVEPPRAASACFAIQGLSRWRCGCRTRALSTSDRAPSA